jgi:hypothetical protein
MEQMGDYIYARNKSLLNQALFSGGDVTLTLSGNSANANGELVGTEVLLFLGDDEGTPREVPGFLGGTSVTLPVFEP